MKATEAHELTMKNVDGPKCEEVIDVFAEIKIQANSGTQNCFVRVTEKNLYAIKKDLIKNGYEVFSECLTNWSDEEQWHQLEINW